MPRFFVPPEAIDGTHFTLTGTEARHASLVLRKKVGDVIDLFDGKDLSYQGRIDAITEDRVQGSIVSQKSQTPNSSVNVILCQALIKGPKWDWLVEKACEIGVSKLVPLMTARTIVKPARQTPLERWKRIALAASKQCGRADVMEVGEPVSLPHALQNLPKNGIALIPWEKEIKTSIRNVLLSQDVTPAKAGAQFISLFIGPEGGWEAAEIDLARRHDVVPVRLGPTLLRSETAGLVAATLVLSERGGYA